MSIQEIEQAIEQLSERQLTELAAWFAKLQMNKSETMVDFFNRIGREDPPIDAARENIYADV